MKSIGKREAPKNCYATFKDPSYEKNIFHLKVHWFEAFTTKKRIVLIPITDMQLHFGDAKYKYQAQLEIDFNSVIVLSDEEVKDINKQL